MKKQDLLKHPDEDLDCTPKKRTVKKAPSVVE